MATMTFAAITRGGVVASGSTQHQIAARMRLFLSLPLDRLDRLSLQTQLRELAGQGVDRLISQ